MLKHSALMAIFAAVLVLAACTMNSDGIGKVTVNCQNVDETIRMLEQEKAQNDKRMAAGVSNFLPVTAVARFLMGRYETNSKISTGEWAHMIDKKTAEMHALKRKCVAQNMY